MQIYLVGGAVRDRLLNIESHDKDFVVIGATVEQMLSLGYTQVGKDFPVFLHPKTGEEYALGRTERKSGSGYTGFTCDFNENVTLQEDLIRRDLTINAMAMDDDGNLYDPYHGKEDLNNKVLRHVSEAFVEDPLRVLRVARFHAKLHHLGFKIAPETLELMAKISNSGELKTLTSERVFLELNKALKTRSPHIFISTLRKCGALKEVMPEIDALFGVPAPAKWHPEIDTGIHSLMTLERVCTFTDNPVTRFGMLCHDLGKGITPKDKWPHHYNHGELGLIPLKSLCERLKVPVEYEQFAQIVVRYHSYMHNLYQSGAKGLVKLFDSIDAQRKPQRVEPFALCCKCDFLGRTGYENRAFPRYDHFLKMLEIYQSVTAKESVEAGFKGMEIKDDMTRRRVLAFESFINNLPQSETDNSDNERKATAEEIKESSFKL